MPTHQAAVYHSQGQPFEIRSYTTPKPGPGELLIAVKSIALNPADGIMRNLGLFVSTYPTVIGFDFAGIVIEVGTDVPTALSNDSGNVFFKAGKTRIAAYAASFWRGWEANFGAFQERVIVPWQHAVVLPDGLSWNHAASLPVSVQVPLCAWDAMGITPRGALPVSRPLGSQDTTRDLGKASHQKKQALLVWGASSSVGTMGVQSARLLKEDANSPIAAVYGTAGANNHEYIASLGADRVFDYKDPDVVGSIVAAARQDGFVVRHCFLATGDITQCQAVLEAFLEDTWVGDSAKIASAPPVLPQAAEFDGIETSFLQPAAGERQRLEQFSVYFGSWATGNLAKGTIRPSPEPQIVGRGLESINAGIDLLMEGVSCVKLVVEIAE